MTMPELADRASTGADSGHRDATLVLAGLHLRLGSLALARAELETLAASDGLDDAGLVDLAEVRWRTGDLVGAGEAAQTVIEAGDGSVVALVVAAEAASALGRPTEARRLAGQAMTRMGGPIDPIFAGMPRSGVWPADPAEPVPSPTTLFPPERTTGSIVSGPDTEVAPTADPVAAAATARVVAASSDASGADQEPGFWDLPVADPAATAAAAAAAAVVAADPNASLEPAPVSGLDAIAILDAGEAALAAGDLAGAALHLGLAVRVSPAIAPAILEAIGETPDAGLQMVRGDAYRAVGRETDARRAYAAAMAITATTTAGAVAASPEPPDDEADASIR